MPGQAAVAGSRIPTRAVVIFPLVAELSAVVALRDRFDPLPRLIRAHITVVFPFTDAVRADELHSHIVDVTPGMTRFTVRLAGLSVNSEYVVLNVEDGEDRVIDLHDRLYSGPLRRHLSPMRPYAPHITIGRLPDRAARTHALELAAELNIRVTTTLSEISVCRREADGRWLTDLAVARAPW